MVLDLPAGTVAGTDTGAAGWARAAARAPGLFTVVFAGIAVLGSVIGAVGAARRRVPKPGLLRDAVRWLTPSALAAAVILGIWTLNGVAGDDPFGDLVLGGLISGVVAVIAWYGVVMWARLRA